MIKRSWVRIPVPENKWKIFYFYAVKSYRLKGSKIKNGDGYFKHFEYYTFNMFNYRRLGVHITILLDISGSGPKKDWIGSGDGSVGRSVLSASRGLQFESSHWQKFILNIYCQLYWKERMNITDEEAHHNNAVVNISAFESTKSTFDKVASTQLTKNWP